MTRRAWWLVIALVVVGSRLAQSDLLWVEEGYPSAAALSMLAGKSLYRDFWFDKPPLFPALYLLWGAHAGVALRIAGAVFVLACAATMARFAARIWSEREGLAAAALLSFYLTFGIPSAVMALAPDLLMVLPHIAAVYFAWRARPLWSGAACGVAMLVNTKAVFVLGACALWQWRALPALAAGFAIPNLLAIFWLVATGSLAGYWQQVWQWGRLYSGDSFVANPFSEGLRRTANWLGFHSAIVAASVIALRQGLSRKFAFWIAIAFFGVSAGSRFFPRYYFLLLPPFCLLAARGLLVSSRVCRAIIAALLLIPAVRFGPRLINHAKWPDLAMMEDSRRAANVINARKHAGDTMLVWGYRPDIYAFTRLPAGTPFLDSQPLTGVIADRHLIDSRASAPSLAAMNRRLLPSTAPTFIVDGLGPYNTDLAIQRYSDLQPWLASYREIGRTAGAVIYERTR